MPHRAVSLAARALLISASFAGYAAPARAVFEASCEAYTSYDPDGPDPAIVQVDQTAGSCTGFSGVGFAFLNGDGEADIGAFQSRAEATILEGPIDDATVYVQTLFRDTITVASPGHSGVARLHATAILHGVLDVTGTGVATVRLIVFSSPGGTSQLLFETCTNPFGGHTCFGSFDPYPRFIDEVIDVAFNVTIGSPVTFGLSLTAQAARGGSLTNDPGSALVDFSGVGDLGWQGFTELTQEGAPIPLSVSSEAGVDWTQPVPEPDAWLGGVAAMLALGRLRKRFAEVR